MPDPILSPGLHPGNGSLLDAALAYASRGWSIVPVVGKRATIDWKDFQARRATEAELRTAFANPSVTGLAVIAGAVSGFLGGRDFDTARAYLAWVAARPDLAAQLPTVRTARGYHVYFMVAEELYQKMDDGSGELVADSKHYLVLPPSRHPSGVTYTWIVPLPAGALPLIDPYQIGLCNRESAADRAGAVDTESAANRENTPHPPLLPALAPPALSAAPTALAALPLLQDPAVQRAIAKSLPTRTGQRNEYVFRLARELKAIESVSNAPAGELRPVVKEWHNRALPFIESKPFVETWADFVYAWERVTVPAGKGAVETAFERAQASEPLPRVVELYDDEPRMILLAKLCRELQLINRSSEFYLDCRKAGELIGADPSTAWRYLKALVADGILVAGEPGSAVTRKASRFRYVNP